jgi:flagellar biosynthesis protein FlhF
MHIRTFRAASLQDALEQIRHQMGPDASVLHTRQVRDGWMGWLGRTYVEVTAGLRDANGQPLVDTDEVQREREIDSRFAIRGGRGLESASAKVVREDQLGIPLQLQAYEEELVDSGVNPATARRWIDATMSFAATLGDASGRGTPWLEHLQRTVGRELRLGNPIRTQSGDRRIVALVGPTGVGKTTTVAKLAAGFRIEAKRRVGLLTIDTFRIAAVQQLRAYAEIMDLPMEVVEKPDQMKPALDRLGDVDLVLIDTAGRSPRSDARIDQLVELLRSAQPDETHLVLSSTSSASSIQLALQGFASVRPTAAILTKLDEAPQTAGVISAVVASDHFQGVPLSYTTNGQQVPDDISTADAESLLSRLLPSKVMVQQQLNAA